ncbi:MAG: hypothetical protein AAB759_00575 [Patescibacteria group bacterium]
MNSENKTCQNCKTNFVIEPEDFDFYKKMGVPAPRLCPPCRFRRRLVFRNERTLYKNTCKLCDRSIVTMYHPKSPYTVYCNDCWNSDKWDPMLYGREYDSSRPFFDQLRELTLQVPKNATYSGTALGPNINSEYTNFAGGNKDCYLIFNSGPNCENSAYSRGIAGKDVFDTYFANEVERIYEAVNVNKSAGVVWSQNISDCLDSWFLLNCLACTNCFGCVNLRHKQYCFFNEQLTKNEWQKRVREIFGSYERVEAARKKFEEFVRGFPRKENNNFKAFDSTGEYLTETKNCQNCFEMAFSENMRYSFSVKFSKDCFDIIGHGRRAELLLECVGVGLGQRVIGSWWVENSHDVEYSLATRNSAYCFGADSVKNAEYVILNKKYSAKEYQRLKEAIVLELTEAGEYGLFFPPSLAYFGYNECIGQDNLPLTKEEALAQGFSWQDDLPSTKGQETIRQDEIPDRIQDTTDIIIKEILRCVSCERNYRLTPAELAFYRTMLIPVPRKCFSCRHEDRIRRRGPFFTFDRTCAKCNKDIVTNIAPNRPEIVYCESCYNAEVV